MKHIRWDFSLKAWVGSPGGGGGGKANIKLFWNVVILHIKLKRRTHTVKR